MPRQRVATPATTAAELVNAYRPRDFLLSSASGSLLGQGVRATATGVEDLSEVLAGVATDTGRAAVAVGALPFDRDAPAHLVVPETVRRGPAAASAAEARSEEYTSELQSRENLVCRLLLEKKKKENRRQQIE